MDRTKSIDGLRPRSTRKKAAVIPAPVAAPTTKKAKSTQSDPLKQAYTIPKTSQKPVAPAATKTPTLAPEPKQTIESEISPEASADFLKPIQAFDYSEDDQTLTAREEPIDTKSPEPTRKLSRKERRQMKKLQKKKPSKARRIITWAALIIVLLLIGGVTWVILWGNDIIAKITGGQGTIFDLVTFIEPTYEPLKTDSNGRTNILAFGTSGYNMDGDEGNGVHDGAQLTDSIMAISINQETGDIAMLSLPRDLKASPTCTATGKINEVYWCNNMYGEDEKAGAEALMEEVSSILGIDFQYYAHLNWGSLIQIVDILGDITITLDEDISDYYWTGAVYEAGVPYTINGEEALGLARARHGTSGGDFSRGASQQKILIGIKDKILEKDLSLTDLISLASALGDNLRTNFSVEELKTMAHLTFAFDLESMRQISLIDPIRFMTTGTINEISYVLPSAGVGNYIAIQDYVEKMLSNDPRVYEDASILVLNGTETPGLASTEKKTLESEDYTNIDISDAPEGTYNDKYTLYVLDDTTPGTKNLLEEKYQLTAKSFDGLPEGISKDYNFVLILGGEESTEE